MDRNFFTGLVLIALFVVVWSVLFPPQQPPPPEAIDKPQPKTETKATPPQASLGVDNDSTAALRFGRFAPLTKGQNKKINIQTEKLTFAVNTQGGHLQPIYLKNFRTYDSLPLAIFPPGKENSFSIQFVSNGLKIETSDLYFEPSITEDFSLTKGQTKTLSLKAALGPNQYLEHIYTFNGDKYDVGYTFKVVGLGDVITDNIYFINQNLHVPQTEKSRDKMIPETNLFFSHKGGDIESLEISKDEVVAPESPLQAVKWVAYKSQFFSSAIIANKAFETVNLRSIPAEKDNIVREFKSSLAIPYTHNQVDQAQFTLYFGPNDIYVLDDYGVDLERIVNLGWGPIRYVALGIAAIFKLLEQFTSNYGVIIFVLAVFIKLLLSPLTYKSYLSAAKMGVVNQMPEVKEIEEKYKDDPTTMQQQKMAFYSKVGINPLGGCVPLLLQLPILFAMFSFFPQSIELRQQSFLWADDLSTYDSIWEFGKVPIINSIYGDHVSLFTILMTVSTLIYTWLQQRQQGANANPQMKYLAYFMPIVFLGVLNNYSAGLSYYYFVLNLLTIGQTYLMQYFIDKDKIEKKIHDIKAERSRPGGSGGTKPKSRLETWLLEQQKKQQQMARERNQGN